MSSLGTMMEYPLTLDHLLVRAERMFPAVPVVSRLPDRSLHRTSYGQIARRARALAEALCRAGLRPGDRVATLMWNHAAHLETYLGVPLAGGVVHTLNLRLSAEELAFIVGHAGDRFLLVDEVLVPLWEKVRPRVSVDRVVVVSAAQGGEYEALLQAIHEDELFAPVDIQLQETLVEQIAAALPEDKRTMIVELADNHARHVWLQQEGAYHLGLALGRRLRTSPAKTGPRPS